VARQDLARFLRERREGLRPAEVGLVAGPRRRTPGLRREEVADLATMSVEYYARLEQARGPRPSPRILDSIASALRLGPAERTHLYRLAGVIPAPPEGPPRQVRPHITRLLDRLDDTAAIVTAATYDVIAWNPLAGALFGLQGKPNLARRRFLNRDEVLTSGHEDFGEIAVSRLRAAAARYPHDACLATLLADLRAGSDEFGVIWDTYPVRIAGHRTKSMLHPEVGRLQVSCDVLAVPNDDQQVVFITADPASRSARALRHLAATLPGALQPGSVARSRRCGLADASAAAHIAAHY
jgi:transcriptional regulator with XRE-family HTH domain